MCLWQCKSARIAETTTAFHITALSFFPPAIYGLRDFCHGVRQLRRLIWATLPRIRIITGFWQSERESFIETRCGQEIQLPHPEGYIWMYNPCFVIIRIQYTVLNSIQQYIIFKSGLLEINSFNIFFLSQVCFLVHIHWVFTLGSILWNIAPREYTVQHCPLRKGNIENQLLSYYPTLYDNTEVISKYSSRWYTVRMRTQLWICGQI